MKKGPRIASTIIQWCFAGLLSTFALVNGLHFSSVFLVLASFLLMPIPPVRKLFNKIKIRTWLIILISVALFITGVATSPTETADVPDTEIAESIDDTQDTTHSSEITDTDTEISDTTEAVETKPVETKPAETKPAETAKPATQTVGTGKATPISPSALPAYSGSPYVVVADTPNFSSQELTTESYEEYSSLDSLGRCGVTIASVGRDIMPTEERGSIGQVKPTGWFTVKYDCVDGKYLYNRCHLIGYQLTGENANTKNLITGTRYMNVDGMLPFENMVADYVKETGNHVAYRVTPIFEGNNLLASGVQMEAYSIEDEGEGICFNIYCYNVQPGVKINYATGESSLENASAETKPAETAKPAETQPAETKPVETQSHATDETTYIINVNTKKFHYENCKSVKNMKEENKKIYTGDRDDLIEQNYEPCKNCNP